MSFIKQFIHDHDIQNNDQLHSFIKHQEKNTKASEALKEIRRNKKLITV